MNKKLIISSLGLIITLLAGACTPTATPATAVPTQSAGEVETSVAQTVAAISTQMAEDAATPTPLPASATPEVIPSETALPSATAEEVPGYILCDSFDFLGDITIPDNVVIPPGSKIKKTWAVRNTGVCTWDETYQAVFVSGDTIGGATGVALSGKVAPNEMTLITVEFQVPDVLDQEYVSFWKMADPAGNTFGWGPDRDQAFWIKIKTGEAYSFIANPCSASWRNADDLLYCPSKKGDAKGYYYVENNPVLENGKGRSDQPTLITAPQKVDGGEIRARFNPIKVPDGFLRTEVGLMYKNESCQAKVGIAYSIDGGTEKVLDDWSETYDGAYTAIDVNLRDLGLVGKQVSFVFFVEEANGQSCEVFWINPRIGP